jgi:hypothetical protein
MCGCESEEKGKVEYFLTTALLLDNRCFEVYSYWQVASSLLAWEERLADLFLSQCRI